MTTRISTTGKPRSPIVVYRPSHVHKPAHEQSFPKKENEDGTRSGNGGIAKPSEPTSTPDLLMQSHEQEKDTERSERVAASESITPPADSTEWIEVEQDDWLDKDAGTSAHA